MTTELTWLMLTAVLAASLWIPCIVGVNTSTFDGQEASFERPPDHRNMPAWVHRAHRAHLNLLEQFLPFAVMVLVAHQLKVSTAVTQWCVVIFFWLRVAHAVGMISGLARMPVRPLLFTAGWVVMLVFAWQVFAHR
ncbi:MAG: MAPEG family protein [Beijerinckiaceae bacterium]